MYNRCEIWFEFAERKKLILKPCIFYETQFMPLYFYFLRQLVGWLFKA